MCANAPGPGICHPRVVDSANTSALVAFFDALEDDIATRYGKDAGVDLLVNNAYSALGYSRRNKLLGRPFWTTGIELFDAVHEVGVRSHYMASILAVRMMQKRRIRHRAKSSKVARSSFSSSRGLIVNTNSLGCLVYGISVPYGMGKCAIDKMTSGMAMELGKTSDREDAGDAGVDVVSWWAKEPMQTEEVRSGSVDEGKCSRRGSPPGLDWVRFDGMYDTALAGSVLMEGRALAAFARDKERSAFSGLAVQSSQLADRYDVRDERGIRSPALLSVKFNVFLLLSRWLRPVAEFIRIDEGEVATPLQRFVFGTLPDIAIPQWVFKLLSGNPITMQWPLG
eukprot:g5013.t1